jgi:hypothetical protein
MNDTVVAIVSAFFIIGIAAGIIAVVAMSVLRAEGRRNRDDADADSYGPDEPPHGSGWDDTAPDGHPHWPGESDTDFRGR